ncbi:MAG TPA: hypothetical protein VHE53_01375 [Patescibacteria group bacterium]|nr:hypothetical protein [Patescibacteria group bacterium]
MVLAEADSSTYLLKEPEITPRQAFENKYGPKLTKVTEDYSIHPNKRGYVETPGGLAYRSDVRDQFAFAIVTEMSKLEWLDQGPFLTKLLRDVADFKPQRRFLAEIGNKWGNYIAGRVAGHKWEDQGPYLAGVFKSQEIVNR